MRNALFIGIMLLFLLVISGCISGESKILVLDLSDQNYTDVNFNHITGKDGNFQNVGVTGFYFGDGSHLTGLSAIGIDTNADTACDNNTVLTGTGVCQSIVGFGIQGSGMDWTDLNRNLVPYVGATRDVNINTHALTIQGQIKGSPDWNGDLNVTGTYYTSFAPGSVLFVGNDGNIYQDNSHLFWSDSNVRLIIGRIAEFDDRNGLSVQGDIDIIHTSIESDDHALEIDVNAAGFGDVKGIDIDYTTGAIVLGEDEEVILININESSALGGDVVALEILATEGLAEIFGMEAGVLVNPILQLSGIFADMDSVSNDGVDNRAEFISKASDVSIFVSDNDFVTIGNAIKFEEIEFLLDTTANTGIKPMFEFSRGVGTWTEFFPADGTNEFRNTGVIAWLDEDIPTWVAGAGGEYLIRITRTKNNLNRVPIEDKVQIASATVYYWNEVGGISIRDINVSNDLNVTGDLNVGGDLNVASDINALSMAALHFFGGSFYGTWLGNILGAAFYSDTNFATYSDFNNAYASRFSPNFVGDSNSINVGISGQSFLGDSLTFTGTADSNIINFNNERNTGFRWDGTNDDLTYNDTGVELLRIDSSFPRTIVTKQLRVLQPTSGAASTLSMMSGTTGVTFVRWTDTTGYFEIVPGATYPVQIFNSGTQLFKVFGKAEIQTDSALGEQAWTIDQDDADKAFTDFQGTECGSPCESMTSSNIHPDSTATATKSILIEINGTNYAINIFPTATPEAEPP